MKSIVRRSWSFLLVLLVLFVFGVKTANAYSIPNVSNRYVNDFSNLITRETEVKIETSAEALYEKYEEAPQVMVVTVDSIQNSDIKAYAKEMYNTYGIGKKDVNVGVLILVALQERRIRVATGAGTGEYISDAGATQLAELGASYFKSGRYDEGIYAVQSAVITRLDEELAKLRQPIYEAESPKDFPETVTVINSAKDPSAKESSKNLSSADVIPSKEENNQRLTFFVILIILLIFGYIYFSQKNKYEREIEDKIYSYNQKENEYRRLYHELCIARENLQKAYEKIGEYERKFAVGCKVDANFEEKIDRYIANEFDSKVKSLFTQYEDAKRLGIAFDLQKAYKTLEFDYKKLNVKQKKFVTRWKELNNFYTTELLQYHENSIRRSLNGIQKVKATDYDTLNQLKREVDNLPQDVRLRFDHALYSLLLGAYNTAQKLHNQEHYTYSSRSSYNSYTYSSNSSDYHNSSTVNDYSTTTYDDFGSFSAGDGGCSDGGGGDAGW